MAILTSSTGGGALLGGVVWVPPSVAIPLLSTGIVIVMLYAYRPPIPQSIGFAFLPWAATGAFLDVLSTSSQYPGYVMPLITAPGVYLTVMVIPGLVWIAILNFSVPRRRLPAYHHYIGAMGVGTMGTLWLVTVLHAGMGRLPRMFIVVIVSMLALLATGVISYSITFWSPDFIDYATVAGGFAIFGPLVNGISTVTLVAASGQTAHTPFSIVVRDVVVLVTPLGVAGFDATSLWAWLLILIHIAIGIHVATHLAPYVKESPHAVYTMFGTVGVVGFTLGFHRLLPLAVG